MRDPAVTGAKLLAHLDAQRSKRHAQQADRAAQLRLLVLAAADRDAQRNGERGRAGRVALRLHGLVSARHVRRILKETRTPRTGMSGLPWSNGSSPLQGSPDDGLDR